MQDKQVSWQIDCHCTPVAWNWRVPNPLVSIIISNPSYTHAFSKHSDNPSLSRAHEARLDTFHDLKSYLIIEKRPKSRGERIAESKIHQTLMTDSLCTSCHKTIAWAGRR